MSSETEQERRLELQKRLGGELGGVFSHVKDSVIIMRAEWRVYSEWFRASKERVELLNEVSSFTALVIQTALRDRVLVKLSRLTDPASKGKNKNATICYLSTAEITEGDRKLVDLIDDAVDKTRKIRLIRNRHLAHSDRKEVLASSSKLSITYRDIDNSIHAISRVIKYFSEQYLGTHLMLNMVSSYKSDEVAFLEALHLGLTEKNRKMSEFKKCLSNGSCDEAERLLSKPDYLKERKFDIFD